MGTFGELAIAGRGLSDHAILRPRYNGTFAAHQTMA